MTVDPKRYAKSSKAAPIMLNIRIRRRGPKPTREEVVSVLQEILSTETVPRGWQFAAINWRHPNKASQGWRTGRLSDFHSLAAVIQTALHSARVAVVRKGAKKAQ